jgi:hypothetical protein
MRQRSGRDRNLDRSDGSVTRQEETGWRDLELSRRHRLWGDGCAMTDIDFLATEYDYGVPAGIVEFKRFGLSAKRPDLNHPNMRALAALADGVNNPFLVAHYQTRPFGFRVFVGNGNDGNYFVDDGLYTEREFVRGLYYLRGKSARRSILEQLDNTPLRKRAA